VYVEHGVIHYAVGNIPGAVPHTSTYALTNATLPYLVELATCGVAESTRRDLALRHGVNTYGGSVIHPAVAEALGVEAADLAEVVA
jgi:alanine dehydrogenase